MSTLKKKKTQGRYRVVRVGPGEGYNIEKRSDRVAPEPHRRLGEDVCAGSRCHAEFLRQDSVA